jgi:hypothetical protein
VPSPEETPPKSRHVSVARLPGETLTSGRDGPMGSRKPVSHERCSHPRKGPVVPSDTPSKSSPPRGVEHPAGWYPHTSMVGTQRYWDGSSWTSHVAPTTPPAAAPQQLYAPPRRGFTHLTPRDAIGATFLILVAFWLLGQVIISVSG